MLADDSRPPASHQAHESGLGAPGIRYDSRNALACLAGNSFGRSTEEGNLLSLHPTVKPVALVADAILDCSARGDVVLDPFLGSGTTLIAAERVGRRCYGMELDPLYVDTIIRRWEAITGGTAILATIGRTFADLVSEATNGAAVTAEQVGDGT